MMACRRVCPECNTVCFSNGCHICKCTTCGETFGIVEISPHDNCSEEEHKDIEKLKSHTNQTGKRTDLNTCTHPNCIELREAIAPFSTYMITMIFNSRTACRLYMTTQNMPIEPTLTIGYKCNSCNRHAIGITLMPNISLIRALQVLESGALSQLVPQECLQCKSKIINCIGWGLDHVGQAAREDTFKNAKPGDNLLVSVYYELNKRPLILYTTFKHKRGKIEIDEDEYVAHDMPLVKTGELKLPGLPWPPEGGYQ